MRKITELMIKSPKGDSIANITGTLAERILFDFSQCLERFEVKEVTMTGGGKRLKYTYNSDIEVTVGISQGTENFRIYLEKGTVIYKLL